MDIPKISGINDDLPEQRTNTRVGSNYDSDFIEIVSGSDKLPTDDIQINTKNRTNEVSSDKNNTEDKKAIEISDDDAKILKGEAEQGAKLSDKFMNDLKNLVFKLAKELDVPNKNQKRNLLRMHAQANVANTLGVDRLQNFPSTALSKFIAEAMQQK